jgi:fumarate reductase subunit D
MIRAARTHPGVWAALAHRLSGLMLALFLPFHFLALGLAIEGEAELDAFLQWSEQPLVKFGEWGLVVLLSVHLAFGLRVLAIEFLSWPGHLKQMIGAGAGGALLVGVIFLMNAA